MDDIWMQSLKYLGPLQWKIWPLLQNIFAQVWSVDCLPRGGEFAKTKEVLDPVPDFLKQVKFESEIQESASPTSSSGLFYIFLGLKFSSPEEWFSGCGHDCNHLNSVVGNCPSYLSQLSAILLLISRMWTLFVFSFYRDAWYVIYE